MGFNDKLLNVQRDLKAPKGQYNSFGKYKYRSAEDILEAVKPLLVREGLTMTLTDEVQAFGDRLFLKATAAIRDEDGQASVSALAEIAVEKKGMDVSQITGTASSYARKYALNGLFLIDDTKDADTDQYQAATERITPTKAKALQAMLTEANVNVAQLLKQYGVSDLASLTEEQHREIVTAVNKVLKK